MSVSFLDKLKSLSLTEFSFVDFELLVSSTKEGEDPKERNKYLVLKLENPVPKVTGSISEYDPDSNDRLPRLATDVDEVKVNLSVIEEYKDEFTFDQDKEGELTRTGSYKGDLFFDVSQHGDVWLTNIKFSRMKSEYRESKRKERFTFLKGRHGK